MILPSKHLLSRDSLVGVGGLVMHHLGNKGLTVSTLWERLRERREIGTYERFILALDTLFLMGLIELEHGLLVRAQT